MAERPEHQRVIEVLAALDADLLRACECWFGGGTAVSLRCGEPRVSRDVDFLCSSRAGYRRLREHVFGRDTQALFRLPVDAVRELRVDRYGVRTAVRCGDTVIKIELVSEGRVELDGASDPALPVLRLTDADLVTEKLLANVDRGADESSLARDVIDLLLLEGALGELPREAFDKARLAYGDAIDRAYERALNTLRTRPERLEHVLEALGVAETASSEIRARVHSPR